MNIYVGKLANTVNEAKLRELFEEYGIVKSITLIKDKFTGALRGFAFVDMPENESAQRAINSLNNIMFEGQTIVVSEARPRENRPMRDNNRPRSSFGGGNGGNRRFGGSRF